jgi:hypothetical protein
MSLCTGASEVGNPLGVINCTEPLYPTGHVSYGRKSKDARNGRIDTTDPDACDRDKIARGTDYPGGDQLLDQTLVSPKMFARYVLGSAGVFDGGQAAPGNTRRAPRTSCRPLRSSRSASRWSTMSRRAPVAAVLPDPAGADRGNETVAPASTTSAHRPHLVARHRSRRRYPTGSRFIAKKSSYRGTRT